MDISALYYCIGEFMVYTVKMHFYINVGYSVSEIAKY